MAAFITFNVLTTEYLRCPVNWTTVAGPQDPTALPVFFAFKVSGDPTTGDWIGGTWETDSHTSPPTHYARALLGPGGYPLTAATYSIWIKVVSDPEIPVRRVGSIKVTT